MYRGAIIVVAMLLMGFLLVPCSNAENKIKLPCKVYTEYEESTPSSDGKSQKQYAEGEYPAFFGMYVFQGRTIRFAKVLKKPFFPTGWMGSTSAIDYDEAWNKGPHSGATCIRFSFSDPKGWSGIAWQYPANNWGDLGPGQDLTGAREVSFWARGESGGEVVKFEFGVIKPGSGRPNGDSAHVSLGKVTLTKEWQRFAIPLTGRNLTQIITCFYASIIGRKTPIVIYLDDIIIQ
jgi:hypothetical protein